MKIYLSEGALTRIEASRRLLHAHEPRQVTGLQPLSVTESSSTMRRLNIFIPTIAADARFGGIATALALLGALLPGFDYGRIVVTDLAPDEESRTFVRELVSAKGRHAPEKIEIADRTAPIDVGPGDVFICTSWWTAHLGRQILDWQRNRFNRADARLIYLIQDFEPAFYPWSAQYALAERTYRDAGGTIAVFNSELLREFFEQRGFQFSSEFTFSPKMNEQLLPHYSRASQAKPVKHRKILVYGRPGSARNAFPLLIEGLDLWSLKYGNARQWEVLSLGEKHRSVKMHHGIRVRSLGKVTLERYATLLRESSVGVSLMLSPHPSYPPLEMAHFGAYTITNAFANKDIGNWHDNLTSLPDLTAEGLSEAIAQACERAEDDPSGGWRGRSHVASYVDDTDLFPWISALRSQVS